MTGVATKSGLFRAYNVARASGRIDRKRLDKALGIAQRRERHPYITTLTFCSCPDFQIRLQGRGPCKHQYALMLKELC